MFIIRNLIGLVSFLSRLLMATLPKLFGQRDLVLTFKIGWDGMHPWAAYSWGGIPRKDFMRFYRQRKAGEVPDTDDIIYAPYGVSKEERSGLTVKVLQNKGKRMLRMRRWFARTMNFDDVFCPRLT